MTDAPDDDWDADLTPKQARFVREYLIDLNATKAAIRADYPLVKCGQPVGFYVYLLADDCGTIFYIGKGKGRRYAVHMREWAAGAGINPLKVAKMEEISGRGGAVNAWRFAEGLTEAEAFSLERRMISRIGRARLTNLAKGQMGSLERDRLWARTWVGRLISREEWMRRAPRSEREIDLADRVRAELIRMAGPEPRAL